jgi:CNT family concentrative nucleoside transporter
VIFAFKILPSVIFFSSLMAVFYYLGVMQKVVMGCAWLMQKFLGTSGAETLSTAANIFVGQTEAPLVVRPYIARMTRSELFVVMAGGMANTAGSVLIAFVAMMKDRFPDIAGHLLTATLMSAPASFAICKLMIPETEVPETRGTVNIHQEKFEDANVVEAAARGATDGIGLAMNIAAILIAFIALIALCNGILGWVGGVFHFNDWGAGLVPHSLLKDGHAALSLETVFGWLFSPLAFIMGVPWKECGTVGALLGQKVVLNEFVAYGNMSQIANQLSDRAVVIASYALSGFANFSSIAIQIGGIGGMAPARRSEIARLGLKAVIGGSLASFLTATIAGFLL